MSEQMAATRPGMVTNEDGGWTDVASAKKILAEWEAAHARAYAAFKAGDLSLESWLARNERVMANFKKQIEKAESEIA